MRRLALIAIALLAILVLAVGESSGDDGGDYTIRAIFDNAAFTVPDEEVRIAGAVVGSTKAVDLTDDNRAAISLTIDDDRFTPFHADAECAIRSEGLLAVKFLECDPGTAAEPELAEIPDGERFSGEKLLPVENTTTPVDLDLVLNTYRQPTGRHLALLLSELGAGVAGRGKELNEIVHRANPTLRETDEVLRILAAQNRELAQFAVDADSVFSAVASKKSELASFISGAAGTAQASGSRSVELAETIERLPAFLRELRVTMADLETFTEEANPVLADLGESGQELGRATTGLAPFARRAIPALESAADLTDAAGPDFLRTKPLVDELGKFGTNFLDAGRPFKQLTDSLDKKKARENLLKLFYNGTSALNGFDAQGHYARLQVLSGACAEYASRAAFFGCDSQWGPTGDAKGPVASSASRSYSKPSASIAAANDLLEYLVGTNE